MKKYTYGEERLHHQKVVAMFQLSLRLFQRTIGAKYRKSFLGYFWMVFPAILITGAAFIANSAGVINSGQIDLPYPLYVLIGVLVWQIFAEGVEITYQAFEGARSYLTRVNFPRIAIVLAQSYELLITILVRALVVLVITLVFQGLSVLSSLIIICGFVFAGLLGFGIGAVFAPFMLLFADFRNTVTLVLSYGLFLTPALYSPKPGELLYLIVNMNPLSTLMHGVRDAALDASLGASLSFFVVGASAILFLLAGLALVRMSAPILIERMLIGGR